jgi:hypothetical protein
MAVQLVAPGMAIVCKSRAERVLATVDVAEHLGRTSGAKTICGRDALS